MAESSRRWNLAYQYMAGLGREVRVFLDRQTGEIVRLEHDPESGEQVVKVNVLEELPARRWASLLLTFS